MRHARLLLLATLLVLCGCGGDTLPIEPGEARILSLVPTPGASGVDPGVSVRVTFSTAAPLAAPEDLWLETGGMVVPATRHVDILNDRVLVLDPADLLLPATVYTAHVAGLSIDGVALRDTSWTFTTAAVAYPADPQRLLGHVRALAHDSMRGRGSASPDERRAAEYLAAELAAYGLEQLVPGSWFQSFFNGDSQNVLAVLPGEGALASSWVVVGAHYDHLGVLNLGDSVRVYNGADDNASGTSAVLEIARLLAGDPELGGDRRSILFAAFGAEEIGLEGSNHFCASPPIPPQSIMAMINLDMVGRLRNDNLILEGGETSPEWGPLLVGLQSGLTFLIGSVNSDQRCFRTQLARPVLALHTGLHADYHQATDDTERIDVAGLTRITGLAARLVAELAVRPDTLTR
jgi:hypothetical protein